MIVIRDGSGGPANVGAIDVRVGIACSSLG